MDEKLIGNVINNLPIEKMVAAPLTAAMKAQSEMSVALANYIQSVGMDSKGNIRMVTFNYKDYDTQGKQTERHIEAPFIAMTGIPNLAVEDVDVSFELTIAAAEAVDQKGEAKTDISASSKWFSPVSAKMTGSVSHSSTQTRSTDTRAKYSFHVSARKQQAPEALMRIIDTITEHAAKPIEGNVEQSKQNLLPQETNTNTKKETPENTETTGETGSQDNE